MFTHYNPVCGLPLINSHFKTIQLYKINFSSREIQQEHSSVPASRSHQHNISYSFTVISRPLMFLFSVHTAQLTYGMYIYFLSSPLQRVTLHLQYF